MTTVAEYIFYVKEVGKSLSEINPGSNEFALKIDHALQAINLLQDTEIPILGGDILVINNNKLVYTYENWYCEKEDSENEKDYAIRSHNVAKEYIKYIKIREGENRYVVLVV